LNPAERLDQETVPTQAELRRYKKRQLKIAANDMVYGQIPNASTTEHVGSERQELMGFVRELREHLRAEAALGENDTTQVQGRTRDTDDYERDLRDTIRAELQEQMRAEVQEQIRASVHEQMLALKQELQAVPSSQPPVSTDVQTASRDGSPDPPSPAVAVEPSRRSVRVKRAKQRT
jgi:hypothetical protein